MKDGVVSATDSVEEGDVRRADRRTAVQAQLDGQRAAEEAVRAEGRRPLDRSTSTSPDKVRSEHEYVQNVKVPGMLHGRVVRPPGINATLVSVDGFTKRIPGLVKVVVQKDFVGVVAEREEQAIRAAKELKVTWNDPGGVPPTTTRSTRRWRASRVGAAARASTATSTRRSPGPRRCSRRPTTTRTSCTARWARPARSRTCRADEVDRLVADAGRLPAPHRRRADARLPAPAASTSSTRRARAATA